MKTIANHRQQRQTTANAAATAKLGRSRGLSASQRPSVSASGRLRVSASSPQDVPFDPALPQDGALIIAEVLRNQFNALQAEVLQRATQAAFDAAVSALNNAIAQCPNYGWVVDALNSAMASAVTTALGQSSNNSNNVGTFDEGANSYYDQGQMDRFIAKLNELILALRRV